MKLWTRYVYSEHVIWAAIVRQLLLASVGGSLVETGLHLQLDVEEEAKANDIAALKHQQEVLVT